MQTTPLRNQTSSNERISGLDLLRAIAIVWVMLFHSFVVGGLGPQWTWLSRYGWMGVDLFFVLSGFLIGSQVLKSFERDGRVRFADFYVRRAFRILPAYWTVLLVYQLWPAWREAPRIEPAWKFLTFIVNLTIEYPRNAAFSHAWSLCVEEHFYLLFPLLALWCLRRPAAWKVAFICTLLLVGGIGLRTAAWFHGMSLPPNAQRDWYIEDIYYPTWNRLDGLLVGVLLAVAKVKRPQMWANARRHANAISLAGLGGMALAFWLFADRVGLLGNSIGWPVVSAALGLLVFAAAGRDSFIGRIRVPLAGWIASISYSLYLVHKAIFHVVDESLGDALEHHGYVAFFTYGAAAFLAAAGLHYAIERPFLRMRERLPLYRAATATPAVAPTASA